MRAADMRRGPQRGFPAALFAPVVVDCEPLGMVFQAGLDAFQVEMGGDHELAQRIRRLVGHHFASSRMDRLQTVRKQEG